MRSASSIEMRSDRSTEHISDCTEMRSDHSADVKCDSSTDSSTDVAEVTDEAEWTVV